MSLVPNHRERQFMQRLRGRGWVKAIELPEAPITLQQLVEKRWVENQGTGRDVAYRITEEGMTAKKNARSAVANREAKLAMRIAV